VDAVYPSALFALALFTISAGIVTGPLWATLLWAAVTTLPLYVRRRWPWGALVPILAGMLAGVPLGIAQGNTPSTVLSLLTALFTLANRRPWPHAVAAFVVTTATLTATVVTPPILMSVTWVAFIAAVPVAVGAVLRNRRLLIARLRETTAELERSRSLAAKAAVADERARVARELHDIVAHSVSVMVVQAGAGERLVGTDGAAERTAFRAIGDSGRQALTELRRLLSVLREDDSRELAPQPGLSALATLVDGIRATGIEVDVQRTGAEVELAPGLDLIAYRIIQEALTNVVKHSDAHRIDVRLRYLSDRLELTVDDDGSGAVLSPVRGPVSEGAGSGIAGMRERAECGGGALGAGPRADGGFRVQATLPFGEGR
jgi:signal transduction histidine kinase